MGKKNSKNNRKYDILTKLFESVFWSSGMADGSSWSNIFWSRKNLIEYAGLNPNSNKVVQNAYRHMKYDFDLDRDQMYLYGYKDAMPNHEIQTEVAKLTRLRRYVLNDNTKNPSLNDTDHCWEVDCEVHSGCSYFVPPEFNNQFDAYDDAKSAVEQFIHKERDKIIKSFEFSDYARMYELVDGGYLLIVIYPLADEQIIEKLREEWKLSNK